MKSSPLNKTEEKQLDKFKKSIETLSDNVLLRLRKIVDYEIRLRMKGYHEARKQLESDE